MRNILASAALLACSGMAMAQSSVTIFGLIDAGVGSLKNSGSGRVTGVLNGGSSTSLFGFKGTEDLGGGLAAGFWLEGALNNDVGGGAGQTSGLDFQRRATVSLSGAFGEVRLGRDAVASYPNSYTFDATGGRSMGAVELYGVSAAGISTASAYRVSNAVSYLLPRSLGGFYGQLQYAFGERASTTAAVTNSSGISSSAANAVTDKTGNALGGRLGYASGRLNVGASFVNYIDAVRTVGAASYADDYLIANIGASYDFGVIKPMVLLQTDRIDGRATLTKYQLNTYGIGAAAPIGAGSLRVQASYYDVNGSSGDAVKLAVGYLYNLSKRTAIYADIARIENKGSANFALQAFGGLTAPSPSAGGSATGIAVGIQHAF